MGVSFNLEDLPKTRPTPIGWRSPYLKHTTTCLCGRCPENKGGKHMTQPKRGTHTPGEPNQSVNRTFHLVGFAVAVETNLETNRNICQQKFGMPTDWGQY